MRMYQSSNANAFRSPIVALWLHSCWQSQRYLGPNDLVISGKSQRRNMPRRLRRECLSSAFHLEMADLLWNSPVEGVLIARASIDIPGRIVSLSLVIPPSDEYHQACMGARPIMMDSTAL